MNEPIADRAMIAWQYAPSADFHAGAARIYSGDSVANIDYSNPIALVVGDHWISGPLPAGDHHFAVRPFYKGSKEGEIAITTCVIEAASE